MLKGMLTSLAPQGCLQQAGRCQGLARAEWVEGGSIQGQCLAVAVVAGTVFLQDSGPMPLQSQEQEGVERSSLSSAEVGPPYRQAAS